MQAALERLLGLSGKKKSVTRQLADAASVFHYALQPDYETHVGLVQHIDRLRMRDTAAYFEALCLYYGLDPLPWDYFDALARNEDEVDEMMVDANISRETKRVFAEQGVK